MTQTRRPSFLKLVHSEDGSDKLRPLSPSTGKAQEAFLPSEAPNTLVFIFWGSSSAEELLDVFQLSKPRVIFDLRVAPRFDVVPLTRKRFFELLRHHSCKYVDVLGRMGIASPDDASLNPSMIAAQILAILESPNESKLGPFVFLADADFVDERYLGQFAISLSLSSGIEWQVYRPQRPTDQQKQIRSALGSSDSETLPMERRAIFISHATPEDNTFVIWLSSKLSAAGYEVWSDIAELSGGDVFWGTIEDTIRFRAAKTLVIHSKHAKGKAGIRKEVYLALKVGERNRLQRFVVPVRMDDAPFDDTLIELIDIQAIDCRRDWLSGLKALMSLFERDGVPRGGSFQADQFAGLISALNQPTSRISSLPEQLMSNWLKVVRPPERVNFFACQGFQTNQLPSIAAALDVPAYAYFTHIATTATQERFVLALERAGYADTGVRARATVCWSDFMLARHGDLPSWTRKDARVNAYTLLNKAWQLYVSSRGALTAPLSNNKTFQFFPHEHFKNNEIRFCHPSGKGIRRQLVGYSAKRRVFWHFGVQARSGSDGENLHMVLTPHVTFSADGKTPLQSKPQLHSLRRSFCRSWWNDRWRDLLRAFVAALADEKAVIELNVDGGSGAHMAAEFSSFVSPVSIMESEEPTEEAIADNLDDDDPDVDEELEFLDEEQSEPAENVDSDLGN